MKSYEFLKNTIVVYNVFEEYNRRKNNRTRGQRVNRCL